MGNAGISRFELAPLFARPKGGTIRRNNNGNER